MMGTPAQERRAKLAERLVRAIWGRAGYAVGPGGIGGGVEGERYNVTCRESRDRAAMYVHVDFTDRGVSAMAD